MPSALRPLPTALILLGWSASYKIRDPLLLLRTCSYLPLPPPQAWKNYFDRISRAGSWNAAIYAQKPAGAGGNGAAVGEVSERMAAALALGVLLAPLGLVAWRILAVRQ